MIGQKQRGSEADRIWQSMVALVWETRGEWRRKVIDVSGLPFSRARILWRLLDAPKSLKDIAYETSSDAPATTVAINDLEDRGLVERNAHPDDRRTKMVSLTTAGKQLVALIQRSVRDDAPDAFQHLSKTDLAHLRRILEKVSHHED